MSVPTFAQAVEILARHAAAEGQGVIMVDGLGGHNFAYCDSRDHTGLEMRETYISRGVFSHTPEPEYEPAQKNEGRHFDAKSSDQ